MNHFYTLLHYFKRCVHFDLKRWCGGARERERESESVCVCERERERERGKEREGKGESVCTGELI